MAGIPSSLPPPPLPSGAAAAHASHRPGTAAGDSPEPELAIALGRFGPPLRLHGPQLGARSDVPSPHGEGLWRAPFVHFKSAFARALGQRTRTREEWLQQLVTELAPRRASSRDIAQRAEHFALHHKAVVAGWLGDVAAIDQWLCRALARAGVDPAKAPSLACTVLASMRSRLQVEFSGDVSRHAGRAIEALQRQGFSMGALRQLGELLQQVRQDEQMLPGARHQVLQQARSLWAAWEPGVEAMRRDIAALIDDLAVEAAPSLIDERRARADDAIEVLGLGEAMGVSAWRGPEREGLRRQLGQARAFLHTLQRRSSDLAGLAGVARLQSALSGVGRAPAESKGPAAGPPGPLRAVAGGARAYVEARQALDHLLDCVDPQAQASHARERLLARLDEVIHDPAQARLLAELHQGGDPACIDMVFSGAEWDAEALAMKHASAALRHAPDPVPPSGLRQIEVQHAWRIASRNLDEALQSLSLARGELLTHHAFRAAKADGPLIRALFKAAPGAVMDLDLMVAQCVRLSLQDPRLSSEAQERVIAEALAPLRGLQGLALDRIEHLARQGFASSGEVAACQAQLIRFTSALRKRAELVQSAAEAGNPVVHAERVCVDLLNGLGIACNGVEEPHIDREMRRVLRERLPWLSTAQHPDARQKEQAGRLLRTFRHIATLQEGVLSANSQFSTADAAQKGRYAAGVLIRLDAQGVGGSNPFVRAWLGHLGDKLPKDKRTLAELASDFARDSLKNQARGAVSRLRQTLGLAPVPQPSQAADPSPAPASSSERAALILQRHLGRELDALLPGSRLAIVFGRRGALPAVVPVAPGAGAAADLEIDRHRRLTIGRTPEGDYHVEFSAGFAVTLGVSAQAVAGLLTVRASAGGGAEAGHRLVFASAQACLDGIAALFRDGAQGEPGRADAMQAAARIERLRSRQAQAGVSATAGVESQLLSLQAEIALQAGSTREVRSAADGHAEVCLRQVAMTAQLSASGPAGLGSAGVGGSVQARVRRELVQRQGRFSDQSRLDVSVEVSQQTFQRVTLALLPGLSDPDREALARDAGVTRSGGTRLFVRHALSAAALQQADRHLAAAREAVSRASLSAPGRDGRQHAQAEARRHLQQIQSLMRKASSYVVTGYGWVEASSNEQTRSRLVVSDHARTDSERERFKPLPEQARMSAPEVLAGLLP